MESECQLSVRKDAAYLGQFHIRVSSVLSKIKLNVSRCRVPVSK